jgi:EAL domain-containing protein (putative c-di-GMP-specific phosphodiesterase class I)
VAGLAPPELLISVNLSAREVVDPEIEERVVYALRESGFEPANLILEVTESVVLEDVEGAIRNLTNLAALGVQIAMDDFGTGYSSFSHLERLPVDILKIDQSFLACIRDTEDVADLAYAIIQLSGTLGVTPIAEGVETAIQVGRLRQMGCHLAQGYYLGMPLDAAATRALLARSHRQAKQPRA